MGKIYRFPEPVAKSSGAARGHAGPGDLVPIRGGGLETTLEMVGFLRSLANQSYLDRYNRVQPSARDGRDDAAAQSIPEEWR
ncbi:hypothetical protein DFR52_101397 [Hoeflea marina]|uniref:Uncharacterized protein n=1 Tax=Hoeflea marina TaxID=274592 RepID=A0A317PQF2_9HYPH|nr:hypothetical protein DFR52_101397 [Hoeflea marina]